MTDDSTRQDSIILKLGESAELTPDGWRKIRSRWEPSDRHILAMLFACRLFVGLATCVAATDWPIWLRLPATVVIGVWIGRGTAGLFRRDSI